MGEEGGICFDYHHNSDSWQIWEEKSTNLNDCLLRYLEWSFKASSAGSGRWILSPDLWKKTPCLSLVSTYSSIGCNNMINVFLFVLKLSSGIFSEASHYFTSIIGNFWILCHLSYSDLNFTYKSSFKTNNIRYFLLYLVHAACELLIVIIDFSFGLVPDDGSSYVQHCDY